MINQLLNYPDDSAGSIMTTEYVDLREYNDCGTGHGPYQREPESTKRRSIPAMSLNAESWSASYSAKDLMTTEDDDR